LRDGEFWSDGYYVATVGERADWGTVEKYIKEARSITRRFETDTAVLELDTLWSCRRVLHCQEIGEVSLINSNEQLLYELSYFPKTV
jgi:hypothetical protein